MTVIDVTRPAQDIAGSARRSKSRAPERRLVMARDPVLLLFISMKIVVVVFEAHLVVSHRRLAPVPCLPSWDGLSRWCLGSVSTKPFRSPTHPTQSAHQPTAEHVLTRCWGPLTTSVARCWPGAVAQWPCRSSLVGQACGGDCCLVVGVRETGHGPAHLARCYPL
jgi:hypothetical protein